MQHYRMPSIKQLNRHFETTANQTRQIMVGDFFVCFHNLFLRQSSIGSRKSKALNLPYLVRTTRRCLMLFNAFDILPSEYHAGLRNDYSCSFFFIFGERLRNFLPFSKAARPILQLRKQGAALCKTMNGCCET